MWTMYTSVLLNAITLNVVLCLRFAKCLLFVWEVITHNTVWCLPLKRVHIRASNPKQYEYLVLYVFLLLWILLGGILSLSTNEHENNLSPITSAKLNLLRRNQKKKTTNLSLLFYFVILLWHIHMHIFLFFMHKPCHKTNDFFFSVYFVCVCVWTIYIIESVFFPLTLWVNI